MAKKSGNWFDVDREGLSKLVGRRGKAFVLYELLQNAWDCEGVTRVHASLRPVPDRPMAYLTVEDDHPEGFSNLAHAYTLFAESEKKSNAALRGRFNLGEKLVLSLCTTATITSTKGRVEFNKTGRWETRHKRKAGTLFDALIAMTREELEEVQASVKMLIRPDHIETTFNGESLPYRSPMTVVEDVLLKTEVADEDGILRRRYRETEVRIYRREPGTVATLYEMGVPVVPLGDDPFHVNVMQKVPLTMERDAVAPEYLSDVRGIVLDATAAKLSAEEARGKWAVDGLEEATDHEAIKLLVEKRFGNDKLVIQDPSDREAENIAKAKNYTVIPGGAFTSEAWDKIKDAGAALPAGQVTPSPKPFHPGGRPLKMFEGEVSEEMMVFIARVQSLAQRENIGTVVVDFANDAGWGFNGSYTKFDVGGRLIANVAALGEDFFEHVSLAEQLEFIIHELGHHFGHHLEEGYHDALCRLGAHLPALCRKYPEIFLP